MNQKNREDIANKYIDGHQMTVVWHVDDMKISHKNPNEITKLAGYLSRINGNIKVAQGKILEYLGMTLDFSVKGEVQVSMTPHMQNVIDGFPSKLSHQCLHQLGTIYSRFKVLMRELSFYHKMKQSPFITLLLNFCLLVQGQDEIYKPLQIFSRQG